MIQPTEIIGENYLSRWHLIPHNKFLNVYLHKFSGSDDDRALHDHPWHSLSFAFKGKMREHTPSGAKIVKKFLPKYRPAKFSHRMELVEGPAWTLFITGPQVRDWGFWPNGIWMHWKKFEEWYEKYGK